MDLRQLGYVVAIVDHGGFTAAAQASHVSQPALSQSVRSLERELGVDLFLRTGRSVRLTAAGEAFIGPARRTLRDAGAVRSAVDEVRGVLAGRLDLVCLPSLAVEPLADLVGSYRRAHPGVRVAILERADPSALVDSLRRGDAEVALTELAGEHEGLDAVELEVQELVAVVPVALLPPEGSGRAPRSHRMAVDDLAGLPLVSSPPSTSVRRLLDDALGAVGGPLEVVVETDHRETIIPLVLAGAGAAVLPRGSVEHALGAASGHADVVVMDLDPPVRRRTGLLHRHEGLSPAARAFVRVATAGAAAPPSPPDGG